MEIKDVTAIAGVVVALGALGLGVYNILRTRKIARLLDWLFMNDKRFELLRTSIETETLHTTVRTALEGLSFKLLAKRSTLSSAGREEVQKQITKTDQYIDDLRNDIVFDRKLVTDAQELTCPTKPTSELIQKINDVLNATKVRYSNALLWEAQMDAHIDAAEYLLVSAERLTEETRNPSPNA